MNIIQAHDGSTPRPKVTHNSWRRNLLLSGSAGLTLAVMTSAQARPNRAHRRAHRATPKVAPVNVAATQAKTAGVVLARARQLEAQGATDLAAAQYERVVQLQPGSVDAARELARFRTRTAAWDQASEAWRQVLFLHRGDSEAQVALATAQSRLLTEQAHPVVAQNDFVNSGGAVDLEDGVSLSDDASVVHGTPAAPAAAKSPVQKYTATNSLAQVAPPAAGAPPLPPAPAGVTTMAPIDVGATQPAPSAPIPAAPPLPPAPAAAAPLPPALPPAPADPAPAMEVPNVAVGTFGPLKPTALAPLPPATQIGATTYVPPARRAVRVSKVNAAKAWPFVNQAAKALNAKQYAKAKSLYQKAFALDPTNPYAGSGIATVQVIQGQFNAAANTYRSVLAVKPNDPKALRGLADALSYGQHLREAAGVNNRILALKPNDFPASLANAKAYTYLRNYAAADKYFAKATQLNPKSAEAWTSWGESLSYRRDSRAVGALQKALALQPNSPRTQLAFGNYYSYIGAFNNAVPRYKAVLAVQPNNVGALVGLGDALAFSGSPDAAVPYYRRAVSIQPGNVDARLGLGRALVYSGDTQGGAQELQTVLAARPGNAQAMEALAMAQGDDSPDAAIATYQALLAHETDPAARARVYAAIGDLKRGNGDYTGAVQAFAEALRQTPNDAALAVRYAQLLVFQGQYEAAKPYVDAVLTAQPNNVRALALQVQIESKIGDPAKAQALVANLANVTPASVDDALELADALRSTSNLAASRRVLAASANKATSAADRLRMADATRDSGDYPAAIQLYQTILAANPNNVQARLNLAEVMIFEKQLAGAQQQIQEVLRQDPNNVDAKVLSAKVSVASDSEESRAEALSQANAILAQNPNNPGALVVVGQVMTSRQKFADAINQFRTVLAANPTNLEARLGLARNLYYSRDVDSSIKEYREVIHLAPTDTVPKLELAQIYMDRNRFSDAEALFNDVLSLRRTGSLIGPSAKRDGRVRTLSLAKVSPMARFTAPSRVKPAPRRSTKIKELRRLAQAGVLGDVAPIGDTPAGVAPAPAAAPAPDSAFTPMAITPPSNVALDQSTSDQVTALRGLGEIRRRQNRFPEALDFFNQALALDPTDGPAGLGVAQTLRGQSKYVQALQQTDSVLARDPKYLPARVLRAQLLGDTGKPQQAQQELDDLVASLPENAPFETYLGLVDAFNSLNNFTASLQLLDVATEIYPNEPALPRQKAETLTFAKKYPEAIALYDKIIAADPQDAEAVLGKARVYNYSDQLPLAVDQYHKVLTLQPTNYQAITELADVEGRRANYTESIRLYKIASAANPSDLAMQVEMARVQRYAQLTGDSDATLTAVLAADPRYAPAYVERGILRGQMGSFQPAIDDLNKALEITPTDLNAQLGMAEVQGYAGNYAESIKLYRAGLQRDPDNLKARTQLALVLSYSGQTDEALKEVDVALKDNPTSADALLAKADILGRATRTREAVGIYNGLLTTDPNNKKARQGLADAYLYGRQYKDSIAVYDQLIAADPANVSYKIQRARVLGYAGRNREAMAALRPIVAADPSNTAAKMALAESGVNSGNPGLLREGVAQYRQILAEDPNNVPARVGLGRGLSYQGNYGEAKTNLNQVLATNPGNVDARYALAETQRFSGKPFDARDNYKAVLATQPNNEQARSGLSATRAATASSVTIGGSYYSDTNGVRLRSFNPSATLRTRAGIIGILAERGKFTQGAVERDRSNYGLLLGKNFGLTSAQLILSRLKYDGVASEKTLYDFSLNRAAGPRQRYYAQVARRDVFESDAAVAAGITSTMVRGGFTYPLAQHFDLEGQATYWDYSDNNKRLQLMPSIYYRLRPTNPSLRVGVGYMWDDTDQARAIYYTPQRFSATSILADYVVDSGRTRWGLFGAKALTDATGTGGVNRPADTLFGFLEHDLNDTFEIFANGGIVRTPTFKSDQVSGGISLRF